MLSISNSIRSLNQYVASADNCAVTSTTTSTVNALSSFKKENFKLDFDRVDADLAKKIKTIKIK